MKELIIVGAGGLGRELLQWIKAINNIAPKWIVKGFINDIPNTLDGLGCTHKILGTITNWQPAPNEVFVCAIGNPKEKEKVVTLLKSKGARFANIIHPTAIVGENNQIGEGLIMYPFARITVNCTIGKFVTVLSSGIGHDSTIGDYSTISSGCVIAGYSKIGKRVYVGSNATIIPKRNIEDDVNIGAGSVVMTNIKKESKVMGNPARQFLPKN
ncbi:sugar O-acyltransferase [Maribellus comscasis]|uniref:Sugar O-acyltransferase n=1 Tax=Maribellus comscasis TaxID=2681766 RepID=A0A6I6JIQ3_9BACT|nr:acetyltransferase [Maribellus comscasis]QGY42745.1 sugar O-acyltransferase [Maribellus comscasis]